MLRHHRAAIEAAIQDCMVIATYNLNVVQLSPAAGYIEGEIMFVDGIRLSFFEFWRHLPGVLERDKYRYHVMDAKNHLIFRYDNAPHHREISTFPHHKHLPSGLRESTPPRLVDVLAEIELFLLGLP